MNLLKKNILVILYFLTSLSYLYHKVYFDVYKLLIFKSATLLFLILNYFLSAKKVNALFVGILILELVGGFFFTLSDDNIILGMGFFFLVNLLLTVIITKRIGIISNKDTAIMFLVSAMIILPATYFTFQAMGHLKLFILLFAVVFSILMSFSFINYRKAPNKFGLWFLLGVVLFTFRYMVGGYVRLVNSNDILSVVEGASYILGIFCLTKAMTLDIDKAEVKNVKSSVQLHS